MNKNLTEMVFILDRSGSMSGLETDTIGGYNSLLEKQKKEEGEAVGEIGFAPGGKVSEGKEVRVITSRLLLCYAS